jgi:hypothetical protein
MAWDSVTSRGMGLTVHNSAGIHSASCVGLVEQEHDYHTQPHLCSCTSTLLLSLHGLHLRYRDYCTLCSSGEYNSPSGIWFPVGTLGISLLPAHNNSGIHSPFYPTSVVGFLGVKSTEMWILKLTQKKPELITSSQTVVPYTHTPLVQKLRCQTPIKHTTNISEPLRISVKHSFTLPDDGSHTIRNMSEWFLILSLLKIFIQRRF